MVDNEIICSDTLMIFPSCTCIKCAQLGKLLKMLDDVPEDGTDQATLFDKARAHLIFPPDPGESFDDLMKNAQK